MKVMSATLVRLWRITRTMSIVVALAVMLALVAGGVSLAVAKPPAGGGGGTASSPLLLNVANDVTKTTTMQGPTTLTVPILQLINKGTGAALDLQVQSDQPPITVNPEAGTATNLSADKLDGKDATALGVTSKTNHESTADPATSEEGGCTTEGVFKACAPVTVKVPTGKQYHVTVLSSFTAITTGTQNDIYYCPAVTGDSIPQLSCIESGVTGSTIDKMNRITAFNNIPLSAASSGEIGPLTEGTYTFSTGIRPDLSLKSNDGASRAHTTVLVRDVSSGPPIE